MITEQKIQKKYQELLPQLKSYLYRLTSNIEDAEDLLNDTYIKITEKREQLENENALKSWIFRIATNLALNNKKVKKRWHDTAQDLCRTYAETNHNELEIINTAFQNTADKHFEIQEHLNFCFTCMSKTLPIEHQLAIILADIYSFKRKEIAQILEKTESIIKHWLFKGRKSLQDKFYKRCALVNKNGTCYQCAELADYFNKTKDSKKQLENIKFTEYKLKKATKKEFYTLRTILIKEINPLTASHFHLENAIMQTLNRAIE